MKVLHVINQLGRGGAERQLMLLQQGLEKSGIINTILSIYPDIDILADFSTPRMHYVIGKTHKFDFSTLFRMAQRIRKEEPDIVHTWLPASNLIGTIAAKIACKGVIINSVRSIDDFKAPLRLAIERMLHKYVTTVTVNSCRIRDYLIENEGLEPSKIKVIYNGLAKRYFEPVDQHVQDALFEELGIDNSVEVITIIANLNELNKCHDVFLKAASIINKQKTDTIFLIVGAGRLEYHYKKLCHQLSIDDVVKFLGSRRDVREILSITSLKMLTSRIEGLPNVLIEAMAAGVPVVTTDAGGCREAIGSNGLCGAVVPVGDYEAIADAALKILNDSSKRKAMKIQCINRAASLFSADKMVQNYLMLYEELIGPHR